MNHVHLSFIPIEGQLNSDSQSRRFIVNSTVDSRDDSGTGSGQSILVDSAESNGTTEPTLEAVQQFLVGSPFSVLWLVLVPTLKVILN